LQIDKNLDFALQKEKSLSGWQAKHKKTSCTDNKTGEKHDYILAKTNHAMHKFSGRQRNCLAQAARLKQSNRQHISITSIRNLPQDQHNAQETQLMQLQQKRR
jgi:hypothetical protein